MIDRTTKLRWRRRLRRSQKQVEELGSQAENNLDKHLFNRLSRLELVRRFVAGWVILFLLIIGGLLLQAKVLGRYYLSAQPAPGGIYTDGIVGAFTNANPLYLTTSADNSVSRLVFSGLFKFDQDNKLIGDLAKTWTVDESGKVYTVTLNENLFWHDGAPLTAEDVVFTYSLIQNPDAKSPLANSWQGIKVEAINKSQVRFTLPSILSAFPYSMVNGIVPKHLLDGVPFAQLRSISFNSRRPVGSGPFKWEAVEVVGESAEDREQRIALVPFEGYVNGKPKIDKFIIRTFNNEKKLIDAIVNKEVNGAAGITLMPEELKKDIQIRDYNVPLTSQVLVFYKNSNEIFKDIKVRQALNYAINTNEVLAKVNRPLLPSNSPLLKNQVGYDANSIQRANNKELANKLLDEAGWVRDETGTRRKSDLKLTFNITTQSNSVYESIANELKRQWNELGVNVDIIQLKDEDLQSSLAVHNYDALLYGISIGPDPDVFAFWHSSQADLRSPQRLNFSEYSSVAADRALEGGRTRSETDVRAIKYKPFLDAWVNDAPALSLYQPRYLYIVRQPLEGFNSTSMNNGADRYNNVSNWMVRVKDQPKQN